MARPYSPVLPPEIEGEPLFHDRLLVVVGQSHAQARRRKIGLADLQHDSWILSRNEVQPESPVAQAMRAVDLDLPRRIIVSGGLALRFNLLATGRFVTCIPHSLLPFLLNRHALRVLPIRLPPWRTPTMIMTLRGRASTPAAELFLARLRERARALVEPEP